MLEMSVADIILADAGKIPGALCFLLVGFGLIYCMFIYPLNVEAEYAKNHRPCPYCKSVIPKIATKCPKCTADIGHRSSPVSQQKTTKKKSAKIETSTQTDDKPASNPWTVVSGSAKDTDSQSNPKCKNIRNEEGAIIYDCPHCSTDSQIDKRTLIRVWEESPEGLITCPVDECAKQYVAPTLHELSKLD